MIFSYLLQDASVTPSKLAEFAQENNLYVSGTGTDWNFLTQAANQYGVNVERIAVSSSSIQEALSEGKIIVSSMVPGDFTRIGHFIVLAGLQDGKVVVHDPNSPSRSEKTMGPGYYIVTNTRPVGIFKLKKSRGIRLFTVFYQE